MTDICELEKMDFNDFKKPKTPELAFIPKEEFLNWYKQIRNITGDVELERTRMIYQECPNCKRPMENYKPKPGGNELWHLCPHCNLTFSEKQQDYFTIMILRLLSSSETEK